MATDRETTIRRAEKLLKQGKLDAAIAEYVQAVEEQPRDWNAVNILGDLYVKAGRVDSAVSQYARVAVHFAQEGFLQKAAALYKKIAKIKPHDEGVLLQLADLSEQQGLVADAKSCLSSVAEHRRRRGNRKGAAEIVLRLAKLDPTDLNASLMAARAAAELGNTADAVQRFKAAGHELLSRNRTKEGLRALGDAAGLDPSDWELRRFLRERYTRAGQLDRAREFAATDDQTSARAGATGAPAGGDGGPSEMASLPVAGPHPADERGDRSRAEVLAALAAAPTASTPLGRAECALRAGHYDDGRAVLDELVVARAVSRDQLVSLGSTLVDADPDAAFVCVDVATDAAVADDEYETAAAALETFVRRVPDHVAALMKLIEVSVDGGLDTTVFAAQARLADAYLAADRPADARVIAEDLVAREPWQRANIDRLRQALVELGEADPDRIVADYLSGASPLVLANLLGEISSQPEGVAPVAAPAGPQTAPPEVPPVVPHGDSEIELEFREPAEPEVLADAVGGVESVFDSWLDGRSQLLDRPFEDLLAGTPDAVPPEPEGETPSPDLDLGAPQVEEAQTAEEASEDVGVVAVSSTETQPAGEPLLAVSGLADADSEAAPEGAGEPPVEATAAPAPDSAVELVSTPVAQSEPTLELQAADAGARTVEPPALAAAGATGNVGSVLRPTAAPDDLDRVFEMFRDEAALRGLADMGAQHLKLAAAYRDIGMINECLGALEVAAHSPRHRFEAASQLAETLRELGRTREAVEWFERAAEAPAPGVEAGRRLLYELGKTLTDVGESERALAVFLELQADAPDYGDIAVRVRRLSSAT